MLYTNKNYTLHKEHDAGRYLTITVYDCLLCGPGLVLPIIPMEMCWNRYVRAFMYFIGLIYCFLGVAIASDIFMSAIEKITSKTKQSFRKVEIEGRIEYTAFEDKVWNETVANLTLMALGSSAPEILLSCIEIVGQNFNTGKLGAGTIVGSAAFNLFVITGVCMVAVPKGEVRKIKVWKVFIVTSIISIFAYLWMIVTIDLISKNRIEVWEAVLTLLFFPLLVSVSLWADHDFCLKGKKHRKISGTEEENGPESEIANTSDEDPMYKDGIVNQEALKALFNHLKEINSQLSDEEISSLVATKLARDKYRSKGWYKSAVTRGIKGSPPALPLLNEKLSEVYKVLSTNLDLRTMPSSRRESDQDKAIIEFVMPTISVVEKVGTITVKLARIGRLDNEVVVKVETFDGTARANSDYVPFSIEVTFAPNVGEVDIPVTIVDDDVWEPEEEFFIRISIVSDPRGAALGLIPIMEIIILDDDNPGTISFVQRGAIVKQNCGEVELLLKRINGCDGLVNVSYRTVDGTAMCPDDYTEKTGKATFTHGNTTTTIRIPIVPSENVDKNVYFFVCIYDPAQGSQIGEINKVKVTISNDEDFHNTMEKLMVLAAEKADTLQGGNENYKSQFNEALSVNGGNIEGATTTDYFLHVIMFPWKVLFACIPPARYGQGWYCFFASLLAIGLLTAVVGDMAEMFGCLIYMKDTVTAITFVALGTSVPDLFASYLVTIGEKNADNAIGNVTGSNSVNVFLGLGLPWTMAAIYHAVNGTPFVVRSGDLDFSVVVYSGFALLTLLILLIRRIFVKAELGGGTIGKWITGSVLFLFWIIYILLSSLASYEIIPIFEISLH